MEELLKDLDAWWDTFGAKGETGQLKFLSETIQFPLPEGFEKKSGFGDALLQTIGNSYEKNKAYEKTISFLEDFRVKQPQLFKKEGRYINSYLLNYYFYQNEPTKLKPVLDYWLQNLDTDIDELLKHHKQLWSRGLYQEALTLAKAAYEPTKNSKEQYIGSPENEFSDAIFADRLQYYYEQSLLSGNSLGINEFKAEMESYDYSFRDGFGEKVINGLNDNYEHPEKLQRFEPKNRSYTMELQLAFQKYMHGLGFHFHLSELIWREWQKYWLENLKKEGDANHFFQVNDAALDKFLSSMKFIFEPRKYDIVQTLWGGNFIYDFLKETALINEATYENALKIIEKTKTSCHTGFIFTLWELSFLHRVWPKPESVDATYFEAEAKLFDHTFRSTDNYSQTVRKHPELFEHLPLFVAPPVKKQQSTYSSSNSNSDFFDFLEDNPRSKAPSKKKTKAVAKRRKKNKQAKKARKRRK